MLSRRPNPTGKYVAGTAGGLGCRKGASPWGRIGRKGESDLYPDFVDKALVRMVRLAKNHPLPDGNKRVAWVAMRYFLMLNEWDWVDLPSIDDAEEAVVAVASGS